MTTQGCGESCGNRRIFCIHQTFIIISIKDHWHNGWSMLPVSHASFSATPEQNRSKEHSSFHVRGSAVRDVKEKPVSSRSSVPFTGAQWVLFQSPRRKNI